MLKMIHYLFDNLLENKKRPKKTCCGICYCYWGEERLYNNLVSKLPLEEQRQYQNYLRMTEENLDELYSLIRERMIKQDKVLRSAIAPELKVATIIHYIAIGSTFTDSLYEFRVSKCAASNLFLRGSVQGTESYVHGSS